MMTRQMLLIGGLCLAFSAPASAGDLPAAEDVFAQYTEAIGGDALDTVKNVAMEFTFSMPGMGLETTGESYVEVPGKSYSMINLAAMGSADFESGVNGDIVWQNNPQMGLRLLEGVERRMALRQAWLDAFGKWKELWERAETVAEETAGDAACYKVVLTSADGDTVSAWFDTESGLLLQEEVPVPQIGASITSTYSDYRDVGGIKLAHRIEQGGPMPFVVEYTDVRLNTDDLPEDVFEVPQGVKNLAAE